nr:hypothetical protein HK105_007332 [Polyrhizophydium stewartii]
MLLSTTRYTIVDVREPAMHRRMHIVGALNVPVDQLLNAHSLRDALALMGLTHLAAAAEASRDGAGSKDQGGPPQISRQPRQTLLVHCQLSLIRGPKAAAHLERLIDAERGLLLPVAVLEGGFKGWAGLYGNRNDLVVLE